MRSNLPEEICDALENLRSAEGKVVNGVGIESYAKALAALNELVDEYPDHKGYIKNVTTAHIRRIIDILYNNRPDLDINSWVNLILMLFISHRKITVQLVKDNKALKAYFVELLGLWIQDQSARKDILDEILGSNKA
jgi:glycyl-tRNA synthetase beta subunit